jgi:hypothetical protein
MQIGGDGDRQRHKTMNLPQGISFQESALGYLLRAPAARRHAITSFFVTVALGWIKHQYQP